MEGVEVPSCFLCPISLEIMSDPVTLTTGITYDRENIERWIFSCSSRKPATCPVTKHVLPDCISDDHLITPNITLRRLIQAWCTANSLAAGIECLPTPRSAVSSGNIAHLIGSTDLDELKKLREIVAESERNRRCALTAGVVPFLASVIKRSSASEDLAGAGVEAVQVLHYLKLSDDEFIKLIEANNEFVNDLSTVMKRGSYHSRAYAVLMLSAIFSVISPMRLVAVQEHVYDELVRIVKERPSERGAKAAVKAMNQLIPWGRNRMKAAKAGAVAAIIELVHDSGERRLCELGFQALHVICRSADGRAELVKHAAGIAVVAKKVLSVSPAASERAVRILHSVVKWSPAPAAVAAEMMQVGAVSKLLLVLQVDCGSTKMKEKAKEMLRLNSRVWKNSRCISPQLLAYYPSSSS